MNPDVKERVAISKAVYKLINKENSQARWMKMI